MQLYGTRTQSAPGCNTVVLWPAGKCSCAGWQHVYHWLCLQDGEGGEEGAEGDGIDILQDGDGPSQGEGQQRTGADRITTRYLTKFERARVLGTRALQIR